MVRRNGLRVMLMASLSLVAAAGCGQGTPPPSGSPTPATSTTSSVPSPTPSAVPSLSPTPPPTDPAIVFAADGIGPYLVGTQLAELQSRALVAGLVDSQFCADSKGATAIGRYATSVTLTFTGGRLASVHTQSADYVTPSGAKVGLTLAEVQAIYGARGTLLTSTAGVKAMVVRVPSSTVALVLVMDPTGAKVASMDAGEADKLEAAARTGQGC
jgi:hypothetical protein